MVWKVTIIHILCTFPIDAVTSACMLFDTEKVHEISFVSLVSFAVDLALSTRGNLYEMPHAFHMGNESER